MLSNSKQQHITLNTRYPNPNLNLNLSLGLKLNLGQNLKINMNLTFYPMNKNLNLKLNLNLSSFFSIFFYNFPWFSSKIDAPLFYIFIIIIFLMFKKLQFIQYKKIYIFSKLSFKFLIPIRQIVNLRKQIPKNIFFLYSIPYLIRLKFHFIPLLILYNSIPSHKTLSLKHVLILIHSILYLYIFN